MKAAQVVRMMNCWPPSYGSKEPDNETIFPFGCHCQRINYFVIISFQFGHYRFGIWELYQAVNANDIPISHI